MRWIVAVFAVAVFAFAGDAQACDAQCVAVAQAYTHDAGDELAAVTESNWLTQYGAALDALQVAVDLLDEAQEEEVVSLRNLVGHIWSTEDEFYALWLYQNLSNACHQAAENL